MTPERIAAEQSSEYARRAAMYRNIDGTEEICIGLLLLFLVTRYAVPALHIRNGALDLLLLWAVLYFGSRAIKKRWTYPRTGFMEPRKPTWVMFAVMLFPLFLLLLTKTVAPIIGGRAIASSFFVLLAMGYARGSRGTRWKRWVALILGLVSVGLGIAPKISSALLWGVMLTLTGSVFLISGLLTLWLYLRTYRPESE